MVYIRVGDVKGIGSEKINRVYLEERSNLRHLEISVKGVAKKSIARVSIRAWLNGGFATRTSCIEKNVQEKQMQNGVLICHVAAMSFTTIPLHTSPCE